MKRNRSFCSRYTDKGINYDRAKEMVQTKVVANAEQRADNKRIKVVLG